MKIMYKIAVGFLAAGSIAGAIIAYQHDGRASAPAPHAVKEPPKIHPAAVGMPESDREFVAMTGPICERAMNWPDYGTHDQTHARMGYCICAGREMLKLVDQGMYHLPTITAYELEELFWLGAGQCGEWLDRVRHADADLHRIQRMNRSDL